MIVDLNPAAQRLTGLEKDQACAMRLEDLFSSQGAGGLAAMTDALDRTGFFHSREGYELRRASKGDLAVNVSVSRIHTQPEPVGLVVARVEDICAIGETDLQPGPEGNPRIRGVTADLIQVLDLEVLLNESADTANAGESLRLRDR